jgi:hypothetical protein
MRVEELVVALCNRWWTEMSHSKTAVIRTVAEEWLGHLGWTPEEPVFLDGAACGYVVSSETGQRVVFYFTMPGELETPSTVVEKGLDYCETTLMLVGEAQLSKYDYIVITDLNRAYVYDSATDELLLSSDSPQLFVDDVMEFLVKDAVDAGVLDELRRDPASYVARQLRTWCERWTVILSREPYGDEAIADMIMDRMLVLRFLYDHSICETPGWSYKGQFTHVISSSYEDAPATAKQHLVQLMDDMQGVWKCDLFRHEESIVRIITKSQSVVTMIQELALMAKTKFTVSTILESFNYGDASEKARVRLVPEPSEERELWLGRLGTSRMGVTKLEVDVLEEGYRSISYWLDRVLESLRRIAVEKDLSTWAEECLVDAPVFGESGEMDLFSWGSESASDVNAPNVGRVDLLCLALEKLFYVWTSTERQRRTSRIVLLLHLIESYESRGFPFGTFPELETAFGDRPSMLDADKQWIYKGRDIEEDEWEVV